jgi:predicted double-glycine peptidase
MEIYKKELYQFIIIILFSLKTLGNTDDINSLCGPYCLLTICNHFKVQSSLEELCNLTGYNQYDGTTLLALHQTSQKKGLPVVPMKLNMDELCDFNAPSIVFVDGNHYLVVHGCVGNNIIIQDPPNSSYQVSKESFKKRWSGEALVFSEKLYKKMKPQIEQAMAPPKGPHILFHKMNHFFGTVNEGESLSYTFTFENIGTDTLEISVRSSCGCAQTKLSEQKIPPQGSGTILVDYDTRGKNGETQQYALVRTNDPDNPMVKLIVSATVRSIAKVVPDKLWMDELVKGEKITREVKVYDMDDSTLKVTRVKTPQGITAKILPIIKENDIRVIPIQLTVTASEKPGDFETSIVIHTNSNVRKEIPVSITGKVLPDIQAFPPMIFFGEVKSDTTMVQEVTLSPTR